ncbi:hypothetical protein DFP72DRAFT_1172115 [Ephemerocybe angulata]|uniref:Uncharacterized protein n=1 Tax=Ephemerocybe angulata TaxID=980116 RepID=A0A8H6HR85_9AGAR|nr:hypothetical protein DFP72DRAFT_1172115 [Tulosesus angulatus]
MDDVELNPVSGQSTNQIQPPSHRHAAPSAPWPWIDISDVVDPIQLASQLPPIPDECDHTTCKGCWTEYPQSRFPNWTEDQVRKSKVYEAIHSYNPNHLCRIHYVDVDETGVFAEAGTHDAKNIEQTWDFVKQQKENDTARVHALFIENMSGPVLQMLGAKYNIEPFYFSSSLNWIPSRFQSAVKNGFGDHMTITLTFLRSMPLHESASHIGARSPYSFESARTLKDAPSPEALQATLANRMIDTMAPLNLVSNARMLALDLLSVHVIRQPAGSVVISFHPNQGLPTTTAPFLHERIRFAGQSVYWQKIFQRSADPTFVLLIYIWHAMYSWDQAMENLYSHICYLESQVIKTSQLHITQELHVIRAHHLHYSSLLEDFRRTIEFIRDTENPALSKMNEEDSKWSKEIMERETTNLLDEIARLEQGRRMQDRRLKNVMNLVFSSVNIEDSKRMQKMTEAAVRDSAAMKQIAYLTMIFLPASFIATVFGMNVKEMVPETLGTLPHYLETALTLTLATAWIIIAFQSKMYFQPRTPLWKRMGWPYVLLARHLKTGRHTLPVKKDESDAAADIEIKEELELGEVQK